jgi:K+/H+ antiporter YhaU regulatory subunit KhtT
VLDQLMTATRGVEIAWQPVAEHSTLVGKSMKEANLRARVGTSVIALLRDGHVIANPKADTHFEVGDMVGVIGTVQELAATAELLDPTLESLPAPNTPDLDAEGFEVTT